MLTLDEFLDEALLYQINTDLIEVLCCFLGEKGDNLGPSVHSILSSLDWLDYHNLNFRAQI